jgi:hypothetical protein
MLTMSPATPLYLFSQDRMRFVFKKKLCQDVNSDRAKRIEMLRLTQPLSPKDSQDAIRFSLNGKPDLLDQEVPRRYRFHKIKTSDGYHL